MKLCFEYLKNKVIDRGLCTGCGTCAGVCPQEVVKMAYLDGEPMPALKGECKPCGICSAVCPGAEVPLLDLEKHVFGRQRKNEESKMGIFSSCLKGYASDPEIRSKGASGGVVTGLLDFALKKDIIDCAVVVGFDPHCVWRPMGMLATSREEIIKGAQSKYSVAPVNAVIQEAVKKGYKKIGLIGLPCHVHALRKIQLLNQPANIASKIKLVLGLQCAAEMYFEATRHILGEWCGIYDLDSLVSLEYRGGDWPGHMIVKTRDGQTQVVDRHQYVYHLAMPSYKRDRCEMCIDWAAELADVAVGDYWSAGYDQRKMSSMVVRTKLGGELVEKAIKEGALVAEVVQDLEIMGSGGFELKRHGAVFRLKQRKRFGWPTPDYYINLEHEPFARPFHYAPERKKE